MGFGGGNMVLKISANTPHENGDTFGGNLPVRSRKRLKEMNQADYIFSLIEKQSYV